MNRMRRPALLLAALAALLGWGQARSSPPHGSRTWIGRYQEVEDYLRTAECASLEMLGPTQMGRCTLRPGGPVARFAWKPLPPGVYRGFRESYKSEIAAYALDRLLKLDMVPPSVERTFNGVSGAAQQWVEDATTLKPSTAPPEAERAAWALQVTRMRMFDDLIGNTDRNQGNILCDGDWKLILLDHSRAFGLDTRLPQKLDRVDPDLWSRIEGLTRGRLEEALSPWLDRDQIQAEVSRLSR
jgi:hypothetical protein